MAPCQPSRRHGSRLRYTVRVASARFEDDPDLVERYLGEVRTGIPRISAARRVGVTARYVQSYANSNPEFMEALLEAEAEANEPVEAKLYECALAGEDWAIKLWLAKRDAQRWGGAEGGSGTTINGNVIIASAEELDALESRLRARQQELGPAPRRVLDV